MSELIVFDTNVLVSYFWTSNENSAAKIAVEQIREGKAVPVFSDAIMTEYTQVLNRRKFDFPQYEVASFLSLIRNNGYYVLPAASNVPFLKDPSDKPFYDAAVSSGAWLVTGNKRHYPEEPFIVSPREYIERTGL